jgi:hypothetical protein
MEGDYLILGDWDMIRVSGMEEQKVWGVRKHR